MVWRSWLRGWGCSTHSATGALTRESFQLSLMRCITHLRFGALGRHGLAQGGGVVGVAVPILAPGARKHGVIAFGLSLIHI